MSEYNPRDKFDALQTSKFSCGQDILHHSIPHPINLYQFLQIRMLVRNSLFLDDNPKSLLIRNNNRNRFRLLWESIDANVIDQWSSPIG